MIATRHLDGLHIRDRMAFVLRARCTALSTDRDKLMALFKVGFKFDDIAEHFAAAEKLARI